jgi:methylated-DNA-protein-cysteine methyltransferase-like protein
MSTESNKQKVVNLVAKIPNGKVVYYGQIASIIGIPPLVVGWVLSGLSLEECEKIPWYRVVAKNGYISTLKMGEKGVLQKYLLDKEGYEISEDKVNMNKHLFSLENL